MSKNHTSTKPPTAAATRAAQWRRGSEREANPGTKEAALRIEVLRRVKI